MDSADTSIDDIKPNLALLPVPVPVKVETSEAIDENDINVLENVPVNQANGSLINTSNVQDVKPLIPVRSSLLIPEPIKIQPESSSSDESDFESPPDRTEDLLRLYKKVDTVKKRLEF